MKAAPVVRRMAAREEPTFGGGKAQDDPNRPKRVRHPVFGEGRVEGCDGEGADQKLIVRFPGIGLKKLLVRVANMELFY